MPGSTLYLDHNATAPCCAPAVEAMQPYFAERFGNALSGHEAGRAAREGVEKAREQVAELIGASTDEVLFSGGGSESLNHAIKGLAFARLASGAGPGRIIISAVEHHAVEDSARWLSLFGFETVVLGVNARCQVELDELCLALGNGPVALVAVMHANNEVGAIQPVAEIGRLCADSGVPFLCDVVQSAGKVPVDVKAIGASMAVVASHKIYGPKGVGALYLREGVELHSLIHGARHERGLRAGTHNVAGIAGMGAAAAHALDGLVNEGARLAALRGSLEARLCDALPVAVVNAAEAPRLPNTSNMSFDGVLAQDLLVALDEQGVAASAGAACRAGVPVPSPTLMAMGLGEARALGGVRFSLGHQSTEETVAEAARRVIAAVRRLR